MPAFEHAVRLGYRYLETDVHVTADGVLVAFHDDRLDRVTDRPASIAELPWSRGAAGAGRRARADPAARGPAGAWPDVRINIDPKHDAVAEPLAEALLRTGAVDRVCVGAFSDKRIATVQVLIGPGPVHVDGPARGGPPRVARRGACPAAAASRSPCAQVPTHQGRRPARHRRASCDAAHRAACRSTCGPSTTAPRWRGCSTSASTGS